MDVNEAVRAGIDLKALRDKAAGEAPLPPIDVDRAVKIGLERLKVLSEAVSLAPDQQAIIQLLLVAGADESFRFAVANAMTHREADVLSLLEQIASVPGNRDRAKRLHALLKAEAKTLGRYQAYQSLDSLLAPLELKGFASPAGWEVSSGGVAKLDGPKVAARPIIVARKAVDMDTQTTMVELAWMGSEGWVRKWVSRATIANAKEVIHLINDDAPVTSNTASALVAYLSQFEEEHNLVPTPAISRLGWVQDRSFVAGRVVGEDLSVFPRDNADRDRLSRYVSRGTLAGWMEAVDLVKALPIPMLAIYASVASILLKPLAKSGFILDIHGDSESGKSTCAQGAASVWGSPDREYGLMSRWSQRITGIQHGAWFCQNLPFILDETQTAYPETLERALYELPDGVGSTRGTIGGSTMQTKTWRLITISTGERSIVAADARQGAITRVLSLTGEPFGPKTDTNMRLVDAFCEKIYANHGLMGPAFAERLLQMPRFELNSRFSGIRDGLTGNSTRLVDHTAVLLTGGSILHRDLGLPGDFEAIREAAVNLFLSGPLRDVAKEAATAAYQFAKAHETKFRERAPGMGEPFGGWLGFWPPGSSWDTIYFFPGPLKAELTRRGINLDAVRGAWRSRGWLQTTAQGRDMIREGVLVLALRRTALES